MDSLPGSRSSSTELRRHCCVGHKQDKTAPPHRLNQLCESGKAIYLGRSDSPIPDLEPCRKARRSLNATVPVIIRGHALMQNIRRGHYEVGVDARTHRRVEDAFTELARTI